MSHTQGPSKERSDTGYLWAAVGVILVIIAVVVL
jgi:hypothetical protein